MEKCLRFLIQNNKNEKELFIYNYITLCLYNPLWTDNQPVEQSLSRERCAGEKAGQSTGL